MEMLQLTELAILRGKLLLQRRHLRSQSNSQTSDITWLNARRRILSQPGAGPCACCFNLDLREFSIVLQRPSRLQPAIFTLVLHIFLALRDTCVV